MYEPPPPQSSRPGTLIRGKYRVERVLGEGAVGLVVEATHIDLNKSVAIKILRPEWQTSELEARFEREARVAAGLPADHIARVTDVGHTETGECFLVMELLVGRDLADELAARGTFSISESVEIILQAMAGVAEAHAAGLVHRDLKPANLFLVQRRGGRVTVKVLDFGLSKAPLREGDVALTQTTSNFGTPQYMSPEQLQSAKHVDARSDQHALAMILFELLTGRPPFEAPSLTSLTIAIATEPPPRASAFRPEVPLELDEAIDRGLAKHPNNRFPDLLAFARAIAPFAGERANDPLELIASALEGKEIPTSTPVIVSLPARAKVNADPNAARRSSDHDIERRPTVRLVAVEGDSKAEAAKTSVLSPAQSSPDGERDPGPLTAEPLTAEPRRLAARRNSKIAGAVVLAAVTTGAFIWALGFRASSPSPAPANTGVPSGEPRAELSGMPAQTSGATMETPRVTPAPVEPPKPAPSETNGASTPAPSVSSATATPSARPRSPEPRGKRNAAPPLKPPVPSPRQVFGED